MSATAQPDVMQVFREMFPGHAEKLENAKTWEEFDAAHKEVIREAKNKLRAGLSKANLEETAYAEMLDTSTDGTAYSSIALFPGQYKDLLQALVSAIGVMGNLPSDDVGRAAAQMIVGRIGAVSDRGAAAFQKSLMAEQAGKSTGSAERGLNEINRLMAEAGESDAMKAINNIGADISPAVAAAIISGVVAVGVSFIWAAAGIFLACLVPIFYFMFKGAACLLLVINELPAPLDPDIDAFDNALDYDSAYNVHGKETGYTLTIPAGIDLTPLGFDKYPVAGFYSTSKKDGALYGTCYGVKLKIRNTNTTVAFGVECPLTGDNKCYCGFGDSASDAAKKVKSQWSASSESSSGEYKISIKMNAKGGECSYYIARVYI